MIDPISPSVWRSAKRNTARNREAPALAQGGIILRPIRDLVPLLRNMMAAVGIHLEGHGAIRKTGTLPLRRPRLRSQIGPICATRSRTDWLSGRLRQRILV